jgi:hypothetical protein
MLINNGFEVCRKLLEKQQGEALEWLDHNSSFNPEWDGVLSRYRELEIKLEALSGQEKRNKELTTYYKS